MGNLIQEEGSGSKSKRFRGWRKKTLFSIIACLLCFSLFEGAARIVEIWLPPQPVDYGLGFNSESRLFVEKPGAPHLRVTSHKKRGVFVNQEFEAHKHPTTFRIVCLGGSSVHYLEEEFSILEKRLAERMKPTWQKVEIINVGGKSYGSHRLVPLLIELLEYSPDLVLVYSGHNEFEELRQLHLANLRSAPFFEALSHFALFRFIRGRILEIKVRALREKHNERLMKRSHIGKERAWKYFTKPEEVAERMKAYRDNLSILIWLCRRQGTPIILCTVPSNLFEPRLPEKAMEKYKQVRALYDSGNFSQGLGLCRRLLRETVGRFQSSDTENGIIRTLAIENGLPLAEIEEAVIKAEPNGVPGQTLFNDHCHLNANGNKIWRQTIEPVILRALENK